MKQFRILKVEVLNDQTAVLVTVQGVKEKIYRTIGQFMAELRSSNLIGANIGLNSPLMPVILRGLQGGIVYGELAYHKAGSTYTISAEHPALTNPSHRLYGSVKEGDEVQREANGFYVENGNLLSFKATAAFENQMLQATVAASFAQEADSFFADFSSADDSPSLPTMAPEDIPEFVADTTEEGEVFETVEAETTSKRGKK
jgi:hypothetical protein